MPDALNDELLQGAGLVGGCATRDSEEGMRHFERLRGRDRRRDAREEQAHLQPLADGRA